MSTTKSPVLRRLRHLADGLFARSKDEKHFDSVAKHHDESLMITVSGDRVKVYVKGGKARSKLARTLGMIATDTKSLGLSPAENG